MAATVASNTLAAQARATHTVWSARGVGYPRTQPMQRVIVLMLVSLMIACNGDRSATDGGSRGTSPDDGGSGSGASGGAMSSTGGESGEGGAGRSGAGGGGTGGSMSGAGGTSGTDGGSSGTG